MDLQETAIEIAKKYESLSMRDKIGIIAQTFGCTSGRIETSPCSGKWRGTSDIFIRFDNGTSLGIGNERTPQAKRVNVQNEYVNAVLTRYNPEIVAVAKETAFTALKKRETKDNAIAAKKGLKPYTILNVELNDGAYDKSAGYMGWYYVTLAVDGKIRTHLETGLNYSIANGSVGDPPARENYFISGALKEADVDYVFNNVGFSSTSDLYSLPISKDVRERAEKTLVELRKAQTAEHTQSRKPSIRAQLSEVQQTREMEQVQRLIDTLDKNMEAYRLEWSKASPDYLVADARFICAVKQAYEYLTDTHRFTPEEVDILLKMNNPLHTVAVKWQERMDDLSDFPFSLDAAIKEKQEANRHEMEVR